MPQKLTVDFINSQIASRGIVMMGEYLNKNKHSLFLCNCGNKWSTRVAHVLNGSGCPTCSSTTLTKEIVNYRLLPQKIKMVDDYVNNSTKSKFVCEHDHIWSSTPHSVMRGKGCPYCAGNAKLTREIVNDRLSSRGITLIEEYTNSHSKSKFECSFGHQWETQPSHVMGGTGCPTCSFQNLKLRKEDINELLIPRGIVMTGGYLRYDAKTEFQCEWNHTWSTTPAIVLSGKKGCPYCSQKGFNRNKGGWAYIFTRNGYLKYGITGNLSERMYNHLRYGPIELVYVKWHDDGSDAVSWEENIKRTFGGRYVTKEQCPDGYTETLPMEKLTEIIQ
jgi:hypothetical protein